jgi:hypothetical protein
MIAYLDPGSGSMALGLVVSAVFGLLVVLGVFAAARLALRKSRSERASSST